MSITTNANRPLESKKKRAKNFKINQILGPEYNGRMGEIHISFTLTGA